MLNVIKGSINTVKAEMKLAKAKAFDVKKAAAKQAKKNGKKGSDYDTNMADITISFCEVSKFIPVHLEMPGTTLLVNYLMLKEFGRRLKGCKVYAHVSKDEHGRTLVLEYSNKTNKGRFELYEMPDLFQVPKSKIPTVRFEEAVILLDNVQNIKEAK